MTRPRSIEPVRLLTLSEAADYLRVSVRTFNRHVRSDLPRMQPSRPVRFDRADLKVGSRWAAVVDWEDHALLSQLTWSVKRKNGDTAIYAQHNSRANGRKLTIALHRLITGAGPGEHVDHINGDALDNRTGGDR